MALPQEIFEQLNTILKSEPSPYRSPDYPDTDLGLEVWAWPIPNTPADEIKRLIQQERSRIARSGADPDITALIAQLPPSLQDTLSSFNQEPQEEIYALYPDTARQKVNEILLSGFEQTVNLLLHWHSSPTVEEASATSQALTFLRSTNLPHYITSPHLVVINSDDIFDILRVEHTDGINYGLDTEAIISKLSSWQQLYGLQITQATSSGVTIQLEKVPRNSKGLIADLLEFCPDLYEITHQQLKKPIELWWD